LEKDTVKAMATVKKGREMFPDNYNMIIAETNLYLAMGKTKEAQENLKLAIEKDPKNSNLYFAVGANYDQIANDPKSKPEEIEAAMVEAEKNYLKAIEIKPEYFDAIYNIGAMYFNDGVRIFEYAAKIDINDTKGYKDAQEKYDARWKQALPYLEKALLLVPDDQSTLLSLKQLYTRTNQPEKLKAVNDKLGQKK
jgi:tetratricopeptide (TPR) repeat protein